MPYPQDPRQHLNAPSTLPRRPLSAWYFCYFAFVGAFAPYFGLYLQSLSFSAWEISVLLSLMQLMRLVGPNLWGWLAERGGRKTSVVRLAALVSSLSFAGLYWTHTFSGVFLCIALMSFFWTAALPLVEALTLAHLYPHAERYSGIRIWGSLGFIVSVLGVGYMLDSHPLSALLDVDMLLLLAILACALSLVEAPRREPGPAHSSVAGAGRQRKLFMLLVATFLMAAAHGPFYVFYSIHLDAHGYGKTLIGALWSLGVVAEIAIFLIMPALLRRHSLRRLLLFAFACAVLRFLAIGWGASLLPLLLLAQLLHGATFGICHAAAIAALHRWFPEAQQARVQALYSSVALGAGGMLGSLASGQAWQMLGPGACFSLGALFALLGLVVVSRGMSED